tara:strand:+ start:228 stop:452 length:225 start_codon:yes stop_codon:yes gene_type:complete
MTRSHDHLDSRAKALIFLWDMMFQATLFLIRITLPLAIVMSEIGNIPSVIYHDKDIDLLKQFRTLGGAPELKTI